MNSLELYQAWEVFNRMMDDPAFDTEVKRGMGVGMIRDLPPLMLCATNKLSREAVEAAMKGRLMELENNGRSTSKEEEPTPTSSPEAAPEGDKRPRKKPLRKDAAN